MLSTRLLYRFAGKLCCVNPVRTRASEKTTGDQINIVAFGSNENLVKLLQSDVIAGIVVEDPFRMGYEGVKTALAASKGELVSANVDTGAILVTKANLSSARSRELLQAEVQ
jgi:ribose transport system substrate-binding protein